MMKKINTIYSHILIALLLALSSVTTVSAQVFPGDLSGATVIDTYQKYDQSSISIDMTDAFSSVFDGTKNAALDIQNLYIRWEITDADMTPKSMTSESWTAADYLYTTTNWSVWFNGFNDNTERYYFKGSGWSGATANDFASITFSPKNSSFGKGYTITAYVSNKMTSSSTASDVEPAIQLIYKVHLNENGKKPDAFQNDGNPPSTLKSYAKEVTLSDTDADIVADNGSDFVYSSSANSVTMNLSTKVATPVQYVRYYLQTSSGGDVDITADGATLTLPDGFTQCTSAENGKYWYCTTASSDVLKNIVLTSANLYNYKLVCVGTSDASTATVDGSTVTKEPVWDFQYTVSFAKPFKGSKKNTKVKNITYTLSASQITGNSALTIATKGENNTFPTFYLYTGNNSDNGTQLYSAESDFAATTGLTEATTTEMISTKRFYIRWYLRDKSGSEVNISNGLSLNNEYTSNGYPASNNKEFRQYGGSYYWYSELQPGNTNLDRVLAITVNSANIDITKYDVVADISTEDADSYIESDALTHEPDNIEAEFVFSFKEKSFEAENIDEIPKVIYKTSLVDDATMTTTPELFSNTSAVLVDLGINAEDFNKGTYWRWYVEDKATGKKVESQLDWLTTKPSALGSDQASNTYGRIASTEMGTTLPSYGTSVAWDPTVTVPSGFDYHNYNIVCVMTTDLTGSVSEKNYGYVTSYDAEPSNLQVKYVFSLILTKKEFEELPFVHYKGASDRDYTIGDNANPSQYSWSNTKGDKESVTSDIRQSVHTWTYDVYVKDGEEKELVLPFENYVGGYSLILEPRGYIRWYDWATDYEFDNNQLLMNGALLSRKFMDQEDTRSRGYFAYNLNDSQDPNSANVGVKFKAPTGFSETVTIACDVSKYIDGMDGTNTYLVHEPTLSNRYLFRIHPAKEMADKIKAGLANLEAGEKAFVDAEAAGKKITYPTDMFNLVEDNSRVSVSSPTSFTLRLDEPTVDEYYFYDPADNTNIIQATNVDWYAYFLDDGVLYKSNKLKTASTSRLMLFSLGDFTTNYYKVLGASNVSYDWSAVSKSETIDYGSKVHLIGYVTDGTYATGHSVPVAHYELSFCDAAHLTIEDLGKDENVKRTPAYLAKKYDLATTLTFDNFIVNGKAINEQTDEAPKTTAENMTLMPMAWDDCQYGFCYPDLYSKQASWAGTYSKMSPLHGDYILLKSMNVNGISDESADGIYGYKWWSSSQLYDITHTYTNTSKYGSFFYVDASDESRTMATLEFDAQLNIGSSVIYTAYVADMTGGTERPQVMARLYAIKKDASGNITEKLPVMSFHSGKISEYSGQWVQIYGRGIIPASVDIENYTKFLVEVDNYSGGTDGADFCVDEISFYTTTGEVYTSTNDAMCSDDYQKLNIWIGAETLQNSALGISNESQTVYYRLCEADGTVLKGIYGNGTDKEYGVFTVKTNYTESDFSADKKFEVGKYFNDDEGEVMYGISTLDVMLDANKKYYVSLAKFGVTEEVILKGLALWGLSTNKIPSSDFVVSGKPTFSLYDSTTGQQVTANPGKEITVNATLQFISSGKTIEAKDLYYDFKIYKGDETTPLATISNAQGFTYAFDKSVVKYRITAQVTDGSKILTVDGNTYELCTTSEMILYLESTSDVPSLELGFADVTYPNNYTRVVRLGLAQINNIKNGYVLHIPVKVYTDSDGKTSRSLTVNTDLRYVDSSDPTSTAKAEDVVATIVDKEISATKMYVAITNWTATVHEGFQYTTDFQYHDASDDATAAAERKEYSMQIIFKIVPEYVNWTGSENSNWNNDENWERSSRAELYKDNTYENNSDMSITSTPQTYVPMKFTKVTVLGEKLAANLVALSRGTDGLYSNMGDDATENIQYDLMVKTADEMATEACEHGLTSKVYDCEKFYGNWCDQIYFKPNAELLNQQNLVYNKAWVDFEVNAGKWYTMASPLKDTYAGDMYAPKADGQQKTVAFEKILFGDEYSRVAYPFYQRSWDKNGSTVYATDGSYNADITYNGYSKVDILQWSHVYNDASVVYAPGTGFSIRALTDDGTGTSLVRLPKNDASYTYYDYSDKADTRSVRVSKSNLGVLATGAKISESVSLDGNVTIVEASNATSDNKYYLVGNPYMAAIDMSKFFAVNGGSEAWTIDNGTVKTCGDKVLPLQSFFVSASSAPTVKFTPDMMMDANATAGSAKSTAFTLTVMSENGSTECSVSLVGKDEAQSNVGLLMDASLGDLPFVYTVAGTKVAAVNNLTDIDMLPVGIATIDATDNSAVNVQIATQQDLYLVDMKENTCTSLSDGQTISMAQNSPGRYYLTTTAVDTAKDNDSSVNCYSPSAGSIVVTSPSANIQSVSLYDSCGSLCQTISTAGQCLVSLTVKSGVYLVTVITNDGSNKSFKVCVR